MDIITVNEFKLVATVLMEETLFVIKYIYERTSAEELCLYTWNIYEKLKVTVAPNILFPVKYDFGLEGYYLLFPYIESASFPTTFPYLWVVLYEIARAIDACHKCGIIHQDIKEKNILYTKSGEVWLIDFDDAIDGPERNDPMCKGTLAYWSPEVCKLDFSANSFARDMWSFGVVIQQLVYPQKYPFSTEVDPDYVGFDIDRAHASSLMKSIQQFINNAEKGNIVWPLLLSKIQIKKEFSDHVKLQQLLYNLWKISPNERWSSTQVVLFLEVQVNLIKQQ